MPRLTPQPNRQVIYQALCRLEDQPPDRKKVDALRSLARREVRREKNILDQSAREPRRRRVSRRARAA